MHLHSGLHSRGLILFAHTNTKYGIRLSGASASMRDSDENATSEGFCKNVVFLASGVGFKYGI